MGGSKTGGVARGRTRQTGPEGRKKQLPGSQKAILEQGGGRSQGESGPGDKVKILDRMIQT